MTNVTCLKTTYMIRNIISLVVKSYLTTAIKGAMKWKISSQACSRAKRFVVFASALNPSLNLGLQKTEESKSGLRSACNVKPNGTKNTIRRILSYTKRQIEKELNIIGLLKSRVFSQVPRNTGRERLRKTEKLSSTHTEISAPVAVKTILFFLQSIMSTVMVTLNAKVANTQTDRNSMITLSSKASRKITSCSVTTAIWEGLATMEYALIRKVQRLSLTGVRSSDRKCALPYFV